MSDDDQVRAGQAVYNPFVLRMYDLLVVKVSCSVLWRCPGSRILQQYNENVGPMHLDVGVGSGYYLANAGWPVERPRIALADLNPNSLRFTADRIRRFEVTTHQANALEPLPLPAAEFDSAAASFLLHCVPGKLTEKSVVLDRLAACVKPGGTVFGSTILSSGVPVNAAARFMMARYNASGIFHNTEDSLDDLRCELDRRFEKHTLTVVGCTALFSATVSATAGA